MLQPLEKDTDLPLSAFCRAVGLAVALDLTAYKPEFLGPRVERRRLALGLASLRAYRDRLLVDERERRQLRNGLTAGVSSFFRDPAQFDELARVHLPALAAGGSGALRIWCAGVGAGQELYTVACLLADAGLLDRADLIGTDINQAGLSRAETGVYPAADLEGVPPHWIGSYFRHAPLGLAVVPRLRQRAAFRDADAIGAPVEGSYDLILCRNLAIYLALPVQWLLYARLAAALRPGGLLFVGTAERLEAPERIGLRRLSRSFYERPAALPVSEGAP